MNFFKQLFGGGGGSSGDPNGMYFYVQPKGCDEVVRVRVDKNNDPSMSDEGGYFVVKHVRGTTCFQPVELRLYLNDNRQVKSSEIDGGALVDEAAYDAWVASREG